jgi:hypothetical protein
MRGTLLLAGFCLAIAGLRAELRPWQLDMGVAWHDNITNGERATDRLAALESGASVSRSAGRVFRGGHRLGARAGVRFEAWPRFEGLDVIEPEIAGSWEFKPGIGPHRPVFSVEAEGGWAVARERMRGGLGGAARLALRQRAGAAWFFSAGHEWRHFDARGAAFDHTAREWFGRVECNSSQNWTLAAEGRERQGDVVSYSQPPRPDLVAIGKPITFVDTFEQHEPWIAYYFPARTRSAALEVQRFFGRMSLTLRHEYRHTLHAGPGYKNRRTELRLNWPLR